MSIDVRIIDGPLPARLPAQPIAGAGAVLCFEGIVRPLEGDRTIVALEYEAYEPMAGRTLGALAEELAERHGLVAVQVEHSRGRVAVCECSFRLVIHSRHRKEGLAAMEEFIDRMKQDVPIWKRPVYDGGAGGGDGR